MYQHVMLDVLEKYYDDVLRRFLLLLTRQPMATTSHNLSSLKVGISKIRYRSVARTDGEEDRDKAFSPQQVEN